MGSCENGDDSIAKQIAPASYWPEMRILILVVCITVFQDFYIMLYFMTIFNYFMYI